jgi:dihydroxyacetone kinase
MGIHNEAGLHEIDPMPSVDSLISDMLKYCLDANDEDRAFVGFKPDDTVLLLINNFGGMSNFELEALTASTLRLLKKDWNITPKRLYVSTFETSLNAPGWSLSLLNVSGIERTTNTSVADLLKLLDADTTAPAWPRNGYREAKEAPKPTDSSTSSNPSETPSQGPKIDPVRLERALRSACSAAIAAEPSITKWDIEMGDGDCGEAVVGMCQGILHKLDAGLCASGNIFHILDEVDEAVEEIGGTLGAIIAISVAAYATNLRQAAAAHGEGFRMDERAAGEAAGKALRGLMGYTSARKGGRTVMDTLIPFCETFGKEGIEKAVRAAEEGAKSTGGMKAKFGRATYVGEKADLADAPPDPGAMAAYIFLDGFYKGWNRM